jgi:UDP-N-acetylglucosamine 1-carboxyvinyltransferase
MGTFRIWGGHRLSGEITPQGAKNEALQIIAATLLTPGRVTVHNIPLIRDVMRMIELVKILGSEVQQLDDHTFSFRAANIDTSRLRTPAYRQIAESLRGSVMITGPLLARTGTGFIPRPGGDRIGRRRIDTHLKGFELLGASFRYVEKESAFELTTPGLRGTYMLLDEASVTGTANLIMAAVLAKGTTKIFNAACEPYIQQLCRMLTAMGARIEGTGSNLLHIEGVSSLQGCDHTILPDMIETGSFIGMAAMTVSELRIRNVSFDNLGLIPLAFRRLGITLEKEGDDILVPAQEHYEIENFLDGSIMTLADGIWPALTPDLLSVFLVTATQARGSVLIHQRLFESRLFFVDKLIEMGARIILCDPHRATVIGIDREYPLRSTVMTSPDIRAGVALLIAALSADGTSIIHNIEQIDRGYEKIDERLNALGAEIERIEEF